MSKARIFVFEEYRDRLFFSSVDAWGKWIKRERKVTDEVVLPVIQHFRNPKAKMFDGEGAIFYWQDIEE